MSWTHYLTAGLVGLAVGRFLCVVVAVPEGMSLRRAVGRRPGCGCPIRGRDRMAGLWWIRNGGRCSRCGSPAGTLLPLVEPVTAAMFAAALHFVGPVWSLPAYLCFGSVTTALSFVDLGHRLIPNRILLPGSAAGVLLLAGGAALDHRIGDLPEAVATGFGYFVAMLIPALPARDAIGMGDVKLAFLLGLFAGYGNWEVAVLAGAGAFVLAASVALALMAMRRLTRRDHLPFGPFMVAAAWVAIAADLV